MHFKGFLKSSCRLTLNDQKNFSTYQTKIYSLLGNFLRPTTPILVKTLVTLRYKDYYSIPTSIMHTLFDF